MPKLLIKDSTMMHGPRQSAEVFVEVVGQKLGLKER